jgi:hypothetical protein
LAVVKFLGYGISILPDEDPKRLIEDFGLEVAGELELEVNQLLKELNLLKPDWNKQSLVEAGAWAKVEMQRNHPELDQKSLDALEWVFTWWWR